MESKKYWRNFEDSSEVWEEKRLLDRKWVVLGPGDAGSGFRGVAGGGKKTSLEAYLSVPTYLRRGIKLPV